MVNKKTDDMADPICRWRNPYLKTIREFIELLPQEIMSSPDARNVINEKYGGDFFHTPYQLACQLGLYYENEGYYYPRFNKTPSVEELLTYLRGWVKLYYAPNPYTRRGFADLLPFIVHSRFCELLLTERKSIDWSEAKMKIFKEQIGNDDILVNTIKTYSDVLEINNGLLNVKEGIEYDDLNSYVFPLNDYERNNKSAFFNHFNDLHKPISVISENEPFSLGPFVRILKNCGLKFSNKLVTRFISSLITKPFVILSGLSGSGKTKLAQAFVQWICEDNSQYSIIPVGADWTNREPLLGYPNALKPDEYIRPDNDALEIIIKANENPALPYFLILDEMNLSHVERYFADFLSVMESEEKISLYSEGTVNNGVPAELDLPSNLFIIGTVNIDETTYMFSPKVLDRANAIEFRVTKSEMDDFFATRKNVVMSNLKAQGASMAQSFLQLAEIIDFGKNDLTETYKTLVSFFEQLKKAGAEFGYRSATEIIRLINQLSIIDSRLTSDEKLDIAIMQKLLPKLHGSRRKLCPVLIILGSFCVDKTKIENIEKIVFRNDDFDFESVGVIYPISLEKITRMYKGAIENGFASYAEA